MLGPLFIFSSLLIEITKEKELKLRQGLSVVGVSHNVFWASWFVVGCIVSALSVAIMIATGMLC